MCFGFANNGGWPCFAKAAVEFEGDDFQPEYGQSIGSKAGGGMRQHWHLGTSWGILGHGRLAMSRCARAMAVASALHVHAFWCDLATWMKRGCWILPKSHWNSVFRVLVAAPCLTLGCAGIILCEGWQATLTGMLPLQFDIRSSFCAASYAWAEFHSFAGCKENSWKPPEENSIKHTAHASMSRYLRLWVWLAVYVLPLSHSAQNILSALSAATIDNRCGSESPRAPSSSVVSCAVIQTGPDQQHQLVPFVLQEHSSQMDNKKNRHRPCKAARQQYKQTIQSLG